MSGNASRPCLDWPAVEVWWSNYRHLIDNTSQILSCNQIENENVVSLCELETLACPVAIPGFPDADSPWGASYVSNSEKVANFPLQKGELGIYIVSRGGIKFHFRPSWRVFSEFEPTTGFHLYLSSINSRYRWLHVKTIAINCPNEKRGMWFHHKSLCSSQYLLAT